MSKDERIEALKAALKWVLNNNAVWQAAYTASNCSYSSPASLADAGCGCCSGGTFTDVPPQVMDMVKEVME